jgi:hypothetical protein
MVAIVKEREMHRDAFEVDMMPSVVGQRSVVYIGVCVEMRKKKTQKENKQISERWYVGKRFVIKVVR